MAQQNASLAGDILNSPVAQKAISGLLERLFNELFKRAGGLFGGGDDKPKEVDTDDDDTDAVRPNNPTAPPPVAIRRVPAELRVNYSGITRKKHPYVENSGRKSVDTQGFRKVLALEDGLQAGDVLDENITPYDQFGKPFLPGEGANDKLLRVEDSFPGFIHNIVGKGYIVRDAPKASDPYGCTPGIRIPSTFQDDEVKPGFRGEVYDDISLPLNADGQACLPENAVKTLTVRTKTVRITPWAQD